DPLMEMADREAKAFPPAEDSGDMAASERQQQKFQLTPEQRGLLGTRSFQNGVAATGHGTGKARNDVTAPAAAAAAVSSQPITFFRDTRPQARWDSIQTRIIVRGCMQILVVEDHQDTREVLTGLLKCWDHDVFQS